MWRCIGRGRRATCGMHLSTDIYLLFSTSICPSHHPCSYSHYNPTHRKNGRFPTLAPKIASPRDPPRSDQFLLPRPHRLLPVAFPFRPEVLPSLCSLYHSYAGVNYSNLDVAAELARESEMAEAVEVKIPEKKGLTDAMLRTTLFNEEKYSILPIQSGKGLPQPGGHLLTISPRLKKAPHLAGAAAIRSLQLPLEPLRQQTLSLKTLSIR